MATPPPPPPPAKRAHASPAPPRYDPPLPRHKRYPIYAGSAPTWDPRMMHPPPQSLYDAPIVQATNDWEVGLFGCFCTPVHCTCALLFPFLSAAYAAHWANRSGVLVGLFFLIMYAADIIVSATAQACLIPVCSVFYLAGVLALRQTVREVYRVRGSSLSDFFAACCCSCCALSQMSAHTSRVKKLRAANCIATLPAYHVVSRSEPNDGNDSDNEWLRRDERGDTYDPHIDAAYKVLA